MATRRSGANASICFVSFEYPPVPGGVSKSAGRVVRYLADAGYRVHVFAPGPHELTRVETTIEHDVTVTRFPPPSDRLDLLRQIHREVSRADRVAPFDLFHGFYMIIAFPILRVARRGRRPLLASIRGSDATACIDDPALVGMVKAVLAQASWVTSVSTDLLDRATVVCPVKDKATLILNAIQADGVSRWQPSALDQGIVGTVGEFRPKKGTSELIEAYARLPRTKRRGLRLIGYYGTADYGSQCAAVATDCAVSSEIETTGLLSQTAVAQMLPKLALYVQPSLDDGLPNALLEAAAAGVPVVATHTGGMRDVLIDQENALLVPPGDAAALAVAMERVLTDRALATRLASGARAVAAQCNPAQERASWLAIYDQLLTTAGRPAVCEAVGGQTCG